MSKLEDIDLRKIIESYEVSETEASGYEYRTVTFPRTEGGSWVLPQCEAILAPYIKVDSLKQTIENLKNANSDLVTAAYMILTAANRSDVLGRIKQTSMPGYSAGTLGLMTVAKRIDNVPYAAWDLNKPENKKFLGRSMGSAVGRLLYTYYGKWHDYFSTFPLLEYGNRCVDGHRIKKTGDSEFDSLQQYMRFMLVQGWVWGAEYSPYMIYNTTNLDAPRPNIGKVLVEPEFRYLGNSASVEGGKVPPWQNSIR